MIKSMLNTWWTLSLCATPVAANILFAGSGPLSPDTFSIGYSGTVLTPSFPITSFDTGSVSGRIVQEVISDPLNTFCAGCVDFIFQVETNGDSMAHLSSFFETGFSGFQTDVGYDVFSIGSSNECGPADEGFCNASVLPDTVFRDATGDVVGFNFTTGGGIGPGGVSVSFVIETDSLDFTDPTLSFIASDGSQVNVGGGFGPFGTPAGDGQTPEPSGLLPVGIGLLGLAGGIRRRGAVCTSPPSQSGFSSRRNRPGIPDEAHHG